MAAYASHDSMPAVELVSLIATVHAALVALGGTPRPERLPRPS